MMRTMKLYRPRGLDGQALLDWIYSNCKRKRRPWGWVYKRQNLDNCIVWQGAKNAGGYGTLFYKGKSWQLHRLVWCLRNKMPIPKGMVLRHKCDRPSCINLNHIEVGTQEENMRDRHERGGYEKGVTAGSKNGNSKLTDFQVRRIRRMYATGKYTQQQLGTRFGVSKTQIRNIVKGYQRQSAVKEND